MAEQIPRSGYDWADPLDRVSLYEKVLQEEQESNLASKKESIGSTDSGIGGVLGLPRPTEDPASAREYRDYALRANQQMDDFRAGAGDYHKMGAQDAINEERKKIAQAQAAGVPMVPAQVEAQNQLNQVGQEDTWLKTYQSEKVALVKDTAFRSHLQREAVAASRLKGIADLETHLESLKDVYDQADRDLASMRVDPRKWEKETPALTQALLLIGAGFFGFITKGRGPNPLVRLIDRAIDRDVKAQEINVANRLKRGKLKIVGSEKALQLNSTLNAAYTERAIHGLEAIYNNARDQNLALDTELAMRDLLHNRLYGATNARYDAYMMAYAKNKGRLQAENETKALQAAGTSLRWDDKKAKEDVTSSNIAVSNLSNLFELYKEAGKNKAERIAGKAIGAGTFGLVSTKAQMYDQLKSSFGRLLAKGALGFQISDQEGEAFTKQLPGITDSEEVAGRKLALLYSQLALKASNEYDLASGQDKARMLPIMRDSMRQLHDFVNGHPSVSKYKKNKAIIKRVIGSK